jgi:hypothetical protein
VRPAELSGDDYARLFELEGVVALSQSRAEWWTTVDQNGGVLSLRRDADDAYWTELF